jgi:uncharacterized RDD family membrane protein YckC
MSPRRLGPLDRLPQAIAEQVVRRIVEVIDIDEIVRRVDVNDVVARVDVNAVLDRVDVDAVVERVDLDKIVDRLDIDAIADRIDIDELVQRANLGPIIAQSTTGMLGEFVGFLRRDVVALDNVLDTVTGFRRRTKDRPKGPQALASDAPEAEGHREGQYAGGITRLLAFAVDIGAVWGLYLLVAFCIDQALHLFFNVRSTLDTHRVLDLLLVVVWSFLYFFVQWSLSGRTIGMALLGARVVTAEGHQVSRRDAGVRTVVLPFAVVFWFVGLIEIVVRSDRRALHDLAAGTCVVYHWQARGASLPWLHRED